MVVYRCIAKTKQAPWNLRIAAMAPVGTVAKIDADRIGGLWAAHPMRHIALDTLPSKAKREGVRIFLWSSAIAPCS